MHRIDIDNQTNIELRDEFINFLESVFDKICNDANIKDKNCELILVHDNTMQQINKEYRQKDSTTDVLSFPLLIDASQILGSIIISTDYAKRNSETLGHTIKDELSILFIHGLLHLIGFDHEMDNGEQRSKEEELVNFFKLPKSLITRTEQES